MKTQIILRYKWKERREEKWLFWLEKKLEKLGCAVLMLPMEESLFAGKADWIERVQTAHGVAEKDTYFVEHDPGCLTILKYIERLLASKREDPALLVAGFNLSRGPQSKRTDIEVYKNKAGSASPDIRLIVLYGGSLGRLLENKDMRLLA